MADETIKTLEARIDKLEELLAHQALTLDEMSGEVARLHEAHGDLMRRHKALIERLMAVEESGEGDAPHYQKPPHY